MRYFLRYSRTSNFAAGNIAPRPRCCQHRPVPRTRREQGVPFFVRAPQTETISPGSVGRSPGVPSAPSAGARAFAFAAAAASLPAADSGDAGGRAFVAARSMTSGGGALRIARPPA